MSDHPTDLIHLACPRCGANLPTLGEVMECQYCGACILLRPSETTRQKVTAEIGRASCRERVLERV